MSRRNKRRNQLPDFAHTPKSQPAENTESRLVPRQTHIQEIQFQGPLPPPKILQQYNEILPGAAERILQQFEKETQHRHALEGKIVEAQLESQRAEIPAFRRGQIFAFAIALVGISAGAFCVILAPTAGHAYAGAGIAGFSLATLVSAFIYGQIYKPHKETEEKKSPKTGISEAAPQTV